jgi:hypothetical protein
VDTKQQEQVNEAAEKFANALKESYQSIADRSVSAQELNAQVRQEFFNGVINSLRAQAENNRGLSEDLIEQQRKQREASQALVQESADAYGLPQLHVCLLQEQPGRSTEEDQPVTGERDFGESTKKPGPPGPGFVF